MRYSNPIISGFYPDPSICRRDEDYYLVTSTFEYFPGVPVFHSRDLIHWEQVGHCLTRDSQLPLGDTGCSGGIYAPTIRYHNGMFYMVTTNVTVGKHFFVYTEDPSGEWSEPVWLEGDGIDPSLFFDEDGKVYFTWSQYGAIYQYEIEMKTGKPLTPERLIWAGTGGRYPEAPHLYAINGRYYLVIAEGGTEYGHIVTIARSDSPWGPFEACPNNPILTHRNAGNAAIQGTGHADFIQAHDGSWWMIFLAFRCVSGLYHHLGRETFLAPVTWDDAGWPVIYDNRLIMSEMDVTQALPPHPVEPEATDDDFNGESLGLYWNFLRNPLPENWSLSERAGWLRLNGTAATLNDEASPAFVGRRQRDIHCKVSALLDFSPAQANEEAGLTILMNNTHHYEIAVTHAEGQRVIFVRRRIGDLAAVVAQQPLPEGLVILSIQASDTAYTFAYTHEDKETVLATGSPRYLSSEVAGGFTGVYFGLYATGNGTKSTVPADFDWFRYRSL